jgi:hypothetical protein
MSEEQKNRSLRGRVPGKKPAAKPGKDEFVLEVRDPLFPLTPEERKPGTAHIWGPRRLAERGDSGSAPQPPTDPPTEQPPPPA